MSTHFPPTREQNMRVLRKWWGDKQGGTKMMRLEAIERVNEAMLGPAGGVYWLIGREKPHEAQERRARYAAELVDSLVALGLLKLDEAGVAGLYRDHSFGKTSALHAASEALEGA